MRKNQLKTYLKLGILFFGVLFFLASCQKEHVETETPTQSNGFSLKRISGQQIQDIEEIANLLERLKSRKPIKSESDYSREIYDSINSFTIDTDEAVYIENGDYHSYTFAIYRDFENGLMENLLLSLQPDGGYKGFIMQYDIAEGQDFVDANTEINSMALDGNYDSGTIHNELSRGSGCWVTDITSLGNNGEEYQDINDCLEVNGPGGCDRVVIYYGGGCPNIIAEASGDNSGGGGDTSSDGGPNADSGGTGYDNGTLDGSEGNNDGTSGSGNESGTTGEEDNEPNDNPETCFQDANGNCIGDTTAPVIKKKTTDQKNCEELQKLLATPNYPITSPALSPKAAIANLKSLISTNVDPNNDQERGYNLLHNSSLNASASWVNNTSSRSVRYRFSANNYGGCHLHPNDGKGHPFFSPEDILNLWKFYSTYNNGTAVDPSLFVHVLVSTKGVYAIKIDNPLFFQQLQAIYNDNYDANDDGTDEVEEFSRPLKNAYEKYVDPNTNFPNGSDTDYQRAFLKFMNNFDGNGTKIGISLYKADANLNSWTKLTLNETTDIITPTPCN